MSEIDRPTETQETYYSPERVDYWISHWAELRELACPSAPSITYDGDLSQHTPGCRPSDPCRYVDVRADLERAWSRLAIWSIEWNAVKTVIDGYPLREFENCCRLRHGLAGEAYTRAVKVMAEHLGWQG